MKIQKIRGGGVRVGGVELGGGHGGCERRIEVNVIMKKKVGGRSGRGWGDRGVGWGLVEGEGVGW